MTKKRIILACVLLVALTILSTGCSDLLLKLNEEKITLTLAGFPSKYENYNLKIYAEGAEGEGVTNYYEYYGVSSTQALEKILTIDKDADFVMVYLFDYNDDLDYSDPDYFQRLDLEEGKAEYQGLYWLDYRTFEYNEQIKYGISEHNAQTVESPFVAEIDFAEQPYYLYKLPNAMDKSIEVEVNSTGGNVFFGYSSKVDAALERNDYYYNYNTSFKFFKTNWKEENIYFLLKPDKTGDNSTATVKIKVVPSSYIGPEVRHMVASDSPDRVYALDRNNNLYFINP